MKRLTLTLVLAAFLSPAAAAQLTNPIRYTWIVTSCDSWTCAAGALVLAGGDKYVMALPTGQEERPWMILRRVEEGSVYIPEDEPFTCSVFDTVVDAASGLTSMDPCHAPLVFSVADGRTVVTSLQKCAEPTTKRRAAR